MTNPDGTVPNWFYYWKELIALMEPPNMKIWIYVRENDNDGDPSTGPLGWELKNVETNVIFNPDHEDLALDPETGTSKAVGFTNQKKIKHAYFGGTIKALVDYNPVINIGQLASEVVADKYDPNCGADHPDGYCDYKNSFLAMKNVYEGIHAFVTTIEHEFQHVKLFCDKWGSTKLIVHPDPSISTDYDEDFYPDSWEELDNQEQYGFTVGVDDSYKNTYPSESFPAIVSAVIVNGAPVPVSAGANYEEITIRTYVKDEVKEDKYDDLDWSFIGKIYYHKFQGKQWKKD